MDLSSLTLAGLVAIGVVNVVTFFKAGIDSRIKFALALVAAFVVTFIPADLGAVILNHAKIALEVAFASSGGYKLLQLTGGTASK
jgi:hypothetical protein